MNILKIENALGMEVTQALRLLEVDASLGSDPVFKFDGEWLGCSFFYKQGFAICFCDKAFYCDDNSNIGEEKILTTILFYNDEEYYHHKKYEGNLPANISFSDDHQSVVGRLGMPQWRFVQNGKVVCARWDSGHTWIVAFYNDTNGAIKHVQFGWNPPTSPVPTDLRISLYGYPDFDLIRPLFRKSITDPAVVNALSRFRLSEVKKAKPDDWYVVVDHTSDKGIELFFDDPRKPDPPGPYLFSGIKYFRRGIFDSPGFTGRLPHGIKFSSKPEELLQLLGNPVTGDVKEWSGYYVWNFPDYLLHVYYSIQEQRVDRVTVMFHPYHSASFLIDHRITDPQI
ncbi:hypothetical protein GCM10027093_54790 [Paraburkholderia jirisanensis]